MIRHKGNVLVETVLAVPLLVMMILGFVDFSRMTLDRLFLWSWGRSMVRTMAADGNSSLAFLQKKVDENLRRSHQSQVSARVVLTPLINDAEKNPLRKKKSVVAIDLFLSKPCRTISPLLKLIYLQHPLLLKVHVYEMALWSE